MSSSSANKPAGNGNSTLTIASSKLSIVNSPSRCCCFCCFSIKTILYFEIFSQGSLLSPNYTLLNSINSSINNSNSKLKQLQQSKAKQNSLTLSSNDLKIGAAHPHHPTAHHQIEPTTPIDKQLNTPRTITVPTMFFPPSPPPMFNMDGDLRMNGIFI